MLIFTSAFAKGGPDIGDEPSFAAFELNASLLKRIQQLELYAKSEGLYSLQLPHPIYWDDIKPSQVKDVSNHGMVLYDPQCGYHPSDKYAGRYRVRFTTSGKTGEIQSPSIAVCDLEQMLASGKPFAFEGLREGDISDLVEFIRVEYDRAFDSEVCGDYSDVGEFCYVPNLDEMSIEQAFTAMTGLDARHLINTGDDERYNLHGQRVEPCYFSPVSK